jgi:hypothetical protein
VPTIFLRQEKDAAGGFDLIRDAAPGFFLGLCGGDERGLRDVFRIVRNLFVVQLEVFARRKREHGRDLVRMLRGEDERKR